jgi:hypothetical protein
MSVTQYARMHCAVVDNPGRIRCFEYRYPHRANIETSGRRRPLGSSVSVFYAAMLDGTIDSMSWVVRRTWRLMA